MSKKEFKTILFSILFIIYTMAGLNVFAVEYGAEIQNQPEKTYSQTFSDVPSTHWAFQYIAEMVDRNILKGFPDGNYYPSNKVTRAEFAKIMSSSAGLNIKNTNETFFSDVSPSDWYTPYINAAKDYLSGYVTPQGTVYRPQEPALREDIAVALVKLKGYDIFGVDESLLETMFIDSESISTYARKYVATSIEKGLMSGYDDRTFRGQSPISRAEAATLLWRAYQYGNSNKQFDINLTPIVTSAPTPVPTTAPTPILTSAPTPVPTIQPTPIPTVVPTPEPTPQNWIVKTVSKVNMNENDTFRYLTYSQSDNTVFYYDQDDNVIYKYDIDNDNISEYFDCGELTYPYDDTDYYKDFTLQSMYYDNIRERLYITAVSSKRSDVNGLSDIELDSYTRSGFCVKNGSVINSSEDLIFVYGSTKEGLIQRYAGGTSIIDPDNGSNLNGINIGSRQIDQIINNGKVYYLTKTTRDTKSSVEVYDFASTESVRNLGKVNKYYSNDSNVFYVWDSNNDIIKCDLSGKLSLILNTKEIEIQDMMNISDETGRFIVTKDENNIIFVQNNTIRIIRRN